MPQQLITGTDCCPCACPDTVTFIQQTVVQGGQIYFKPVAPVSPPDDPTKPAITYVVDGTVYGWDDVFQTWIQIGSVGPGGIKQVYNGSGPPGLLVPANPNEPAIYYDLAQGGLMSLWRTAPAGWF